MINTVGVIELIDGQPTSFHAWNDDDEGDRKARDFFAIVLTEVSDVDLTLEEIEKYIDDGFYEQGNWSLALVHSTVEPQEP